MVVTAGIPVYLHYCGGELEDVSYVIKKNSCCGGDEEDTPMDCCMDQDLVLRSNPDCTMGQQLHFETVPHFLIFHQAGTPVFFSILPGELFYTSALRLPPPKPPADVLASISVLRI